MLKHVLTSGDVSKFSTTGNIQATGLLEVAILICTADGISDDPEHGRIDQHSRTAVLK